MNTKTFPLDEILSVSIGRLVADRHVAALYDLIGHITNDEGVSTIGLAMYADSTRKFLLEQFPELENVELDTLELGLAAAKKRGKGRREIETILIWSACRLWIDRMAKDIGKTEFAVPQMKDTRPKTMRDEIDYIADIKSKS